MELTEQVEDLATEKWKGIQKNFQNIGHREGHHDDQEEKKCSGVTSRSERPSKNRWRDRKKFIKVAAKETDSNSEEAAAGICQALATPCLFLHAICSVRHMFRLQGRKAGQNLEGKKKKKKIYPCLNHVAKRFKVG